MDGQGGTPKDLNYLPYLACHNSKTKQTIKILIDSGANKNIIRPHIIKKTEKTEPKVIKNILGTQKVDQKITINFLGHSLPTQVYYVTEFHNFFDAILGSQFLAQNKAKIDYDKETLTVKDVTFKFKKYFPTKKMYYHTITIKTENDGDWLVPTQQKLSGKIIIEPGLYNSSQNRTVVNILSPKKKPPKIIPKIGLKVNNFETIQPIEIDHDDDLSKEAIEKLIRIEHMSQLEKSEIINLIHENQQILLKQNEKLSATTAIKHGILTKDEEPIYTKTYRYPHHFKKDVEEQIKELLDSGIIRHSKSPYSAPIWVVPKKMDASGKRKIRVVIDYRKLNEKTVNDKYPIPQIEEILDNMGKSEYFTTLDLKSGFHQILMDEKSIEKTAFSTDKGHFEFTRMPFGLKNAPATFQRAMNNVLQGLIGDVCYVYLDDIIIMGHSLQNHLKNVKTVLKRLAEFNLKIQLDKCEFLKRETQFLGHIITPEGVKPDPDKIQKILEWPLPKTEKELRAFLGLVGYYRRFIKNFAKTVKAMSKYLKLGLQINLTDPEYLKTFKRIKTIISTDQILAYPDFSSPFILTTDASDFALGAVLSQIQNGIERPIAFASRTLNDTETRYATNEKEALAIIWAVKKFKPYLYGNKFTLMTDHKPLTFIKTSEKNSKILRWRLEKTSTMTLFTKKEKPTL